MNKEKKSLGRGLDSLLGERKTQTSQGDSEIHLEDLKPGEYQPRRKMHKETLEDLSKSCLLYTSPRPRDATLSRMPSSA
mgnify:CR=1 FL=1